VDAFASDLSAAVAHARERGHEPAASAAIYGGVPGGTTVESEQFLRSVMAQILDAQQDVPTRA
jgi:hypothetical protein